MFLTKKFKYSSDSETLYIEVESKEKPECHAVRPQKRNSVKSRDEIVEGPKTPELSNLPSNFAIKPYRAFDCRQPAPLLLSPRDHPKDQTILM